MNTVFCPNCQSELDDASLKFCTSCGTRFPESAAAQSIPTVLITEVPMASVASEPEVVVFGAGPQEQEPMLVRRTRTSPFMARQVADDDVPLISRAWAARASRTTKPQLGRQRKMAGDLPTWDPMPPSELVVKRAAKFP